MNILFLTLLNFESLNESNIYTDLLSEFVDNGHQVFVISPYERRFNKTTKLIKGNNYQILKKKIGNIQKTNLIEKGITTLLIDFYFLSAFKKFYKEINFELIIYSTPPINFIRTISYVKKKYGAMAYLYI